MQVKVSAEVTTSPVTNIDALLRYAGAVAEIEGKNLFIHTAKIGVAAGDLAACLTEGSDWFPSKDEIYDEVASLVLRSVIFGLANGMTTEDLQTALGRETENLVTRGFQKKIEKSVEGTCFYIGSSLMTATFGEVSGD